ncbi:unnamed protein product [Rotaria sp. Silwood2]|nr:unnamed protein product [Rotaria sp. Silwood2]
MKSNVLKLFRTAINAVDPYTCVKHHLVFNNNNNNHLNNGIAELHIGNNHIILNHNLYVAAFGKAAIGTHKSFDVLLIRNNIYILLYFIRYVSSCR